MATGFRTDSQRWRGVWLAFVLDASLVWICFLSGIWFRFGVVEWQGVWVYAPGIALASLSMPSLLYVGGFYSAGGPAGGAFSRLRWLLAALGSVFLVILVVGSINFSSRMGRGVLASSATILIPLVLLRHSRLLRLREHRWERIWCLVSSEDDEAAAMLLNHLWGKDARHLGLVAGRGYQPKSPLPLECRLDEGGSVPRGERIDLMLVRDQHLVDPLFGPFVRRLRYQGVEIVSLADACEEAYQAIPLGLVTESWLFRASHQPGLFYIKKMKRLFDVLASLVFLVLLSPALLFGIVAVRLSSPGPIFFRQARAGRLEKPFMVVKLRTMRMALPEDREMQWAGTDDPRVFRIGRWLRKFRIDEIPQFWNILKGDMSFVGPRPEQTPLIETLSREIPYYRERLLVQPGLTGWAQVRYPYGASIEDAARKLEYDLYYMKQMSLFLDFFILLETVKTVLLGGVRDGGDPAYSRFRASLGSLLQNGSPNPVSKAALEGAE